MSEAVGDALAAAIAAARDIDVAGAAARCGFAYEGSAKEGTIAASFLGQPVPLTFPGFEPVGEPVLPPHVRAMVVYHLATSDGSTPTGSWIAFSQLPDAVFYVDAWRGYTGAALARRFGDDVGSVAEGARRIGGEPTGIPGDVAVVLPVMPLLPIAFQYWAGDDEFEARAEFLFDETAGRQLPTDCNAVLCAWLAHLLSHGSQHSGRKP